MEQLRQLAELRDAGILSEEEFTSKKAEILARMWLTRARAGTREGAGPDGSDVPADRWISSVPAAQ
ncbi:SHOCT domain-containing protein [Streptomyces nigra]|uniref:SHOCT domain-containing protein n=1 Tax=Streptomyces nigra TaxID=1827580 RepID=UPI00380BBED3